MNVRTNAGTPLPGTPTPKHVWTGHNGLKIAGDAWGDESRPLVILQHGGGQTRHAWKNTGQMLAEAGYYAVALDARGHSDSGWAADGDYTVDAMVEDVRCVVGHLGGKKPALVGASMGGGTSIVAVGEQLLDATCLVLVDVAPSIQSEGVKEIHDFLDQRPDGFESLEAVAQAIANYQPHRPRPRNLDGLAKNVRLGADGRYHWHWDPAWRKGTRSMSDYRARLHAAANRLDIPTLLVRGGLSNVLSEEGARRFLEQCPEAEYVNVENAAHMVAGDRNDIFAAAVVDFLKRAMPSD